MNKALNIKSVFVLVALMVISVFVVVKFGFDTTETTRNLLDNAKDISKTGTNSKTEVHGNSNDNLRLHIVYEIYAVDDWNAEHTLKYGITSQKNYKTKRGNPRPQLQLKKIAVGSQYESYTISYKMLYQNIEGRTNAKNIEKKLVSEYFYSHDKLMPPFQQLPVPEEYINF